MSRVTSRAASRAPNPRSRSSPRAASTSAAPAEIEAALAELRERGFGARDAARLVALLTGRSARDLYRP